MANSKWSMFGPAGKWLADISGKRANVNPYGALNPEQVRVNQLLGNKFSSMLESGPELYSGQLSEGIGQGEVEALDRYNRLSVLNNERLNQLSNVDEGVFNERFRSEITDPSFATFREEIQPLIEESLPTFSTARGNVIARSAGQLGRDLLSTRFQAREAMKDRSLRAIAEAQNLGRTDMALNAVPREIKQAGLDRNFVNWISANDRYSNQIGHMLNFLGISTGTVDPDNPTFDRLMAIIGATAKMASAGSGGGSGGTLTATNPN